LDLESEHLGIQEIISLWKQHEARISSLEASLEDNGFEALKKARRLHFDVAIVDMSLPDILGDELVRRLSEEREGLKFLMITGYSSYKARFESLGSGIKVLMKPVSVEEMLEALRELA